MSGLWISAGIKVVEGKDIDQARKALVDLVDVSRQEPGNIKFQILQQLDNSACFTLWECWEDEAALQEHFSAEHTVKYLAEGWTEVVYIEKLEDTEQVVNGKAA